MSCLALPIDKLFQLLTEPNETLIVKSLELIRNLLCTQAHVDHIMSQYGGSKIIQAVIMILEGEYTHVGIKQQALCILANIADGLTAKDFIMGNEDLLRKINNYMVSVIFCCFVCFSSCMLERYNFHPRPI